MLCEVPIHQWRAWRGLTDVRCCPSCGMAKRWPLPDEAELAGIYQKGYYDAWGDSEFYWATKKTLYRKLIQLSGVPASKAKLLDVGCATGAGLEAADEMGCEAYGIDVNPHAVETAQKRVPSAVVHECSIEQAPFEDAFFDVILMSDVLEHVQNPRKCMEKVFQLLKKGGVVVILTPDIGSASARLMGARWAHIKKEHLFYFSKKSIKILLKERHFKISKLGMFWKPLTIGYAIAQFEKYPLPVMTPMMKLLQKVLPQPLQKSIFWMPMGEMVVCAQKE